MTTKNEIIKKFLDKGSLLSPEAVHFLEDKNVEELLKTEYRKLILTERDFQFSKVRIIKNLTEKPKELTTDGYLKFYNDKYEKMRGIILERIQKDFVSINKLDALRQEVNIIGIIREIKKKENKTTVEIEDLTGSVQGIFEEIPANISENDVVAVTGVSAGKVLYAKKIILPDIPLRQAKKGFDKICLISDLSLDETPIHEVERFLRWFETQNVRFLIISGDVGDKKKFEDMINRFCYNKTVIVASGNNGTDKEYPNLAEQYENKNIISVSNPSAIEINNLIILMVHRFNLEMLKKRYLGESKVILPEDYLVLDVIPDIVLCGYTKKPEISNYKSVTIINAGSPLTDFRPVVIDLSTRETEQINTEKINI